MRRLQPLLLAGLATLALAGCSRPDSQAPAPVESLVPLPSEQPAPPTPTPKPAPPVASTRPAPATPANDDCGAGKLKTYLGQLPTTDVVDKIRAAVAHERIRTIKPGDAVTMDYRSDRLNIEIGEDGRIKQLRCG